jgi:ABC-type polysaccharide/polyol phosphate export permease
MSLRASAALTTAAWRTAKSYRLSFVLSFASLAVTIIPVYFVANALQPFMASVIADEGREYFGFVLLGTAILTMVSPALSSFSSAVSGGLSSGFFEALLATPTSLPALLAGQTGYAFAWAFARVILLVAAGSALGVDIHWLRLLEAVLITAIVVAAYGGIGLLAAALVVSFRTNASIPQAVLVASTLLGGVYFPTSVLPPIVSPLAEWLPLTPGLRALRQTLLLDYPLSTVAGDVMQLLGLTAACLLVGIVSLRWAFAYARRAGSLAQY